MFKLVSHSHGNPSRLGRRLQFLSVFSETIKHLQNFENLQHPQLVHGQEQVQRQCTMCTQKIAKLASWPSQSGQSGALVNEDSYLAKWRTPNRQFGVVAKAR